MVPRKKQVNPCKTFESQPSGGASPPRPGEGPELKDDPGDPDTDSAQDSESNPILDLSPQVPPLLDHQEAARKGQGGEAQNFIRYEQKVFAQLAA